MKLIVKRSIIVLVMLVIFICGYFFGVTASFILPGPSRPPIDLTEDISIKSSITNIEATLLRGSEHEPFVFDGSDERAYLSIKYPKTSIIINKDLFEGNGNFETLIQSLKWLDENRILVERTIQDKKDDIEFDLKEMRWRSIEKDLLTIQ